MHFFFTPLSYEHNYGVIQDPQIVHLIMYMNGNTQEWTWLTNCNSMLNSHNILQAYFMQIAYVHWFVFKYLMLCHNSSVQFFTLRN